MDWSLIVVASGLQVTAKYPNIKYEHLNNDKLNS